jgi:hypothetical protein
MAKNEIPDYKQWIRQSKLAHFERLSLAAGLEAERQGLTEEELEAEMEEIKEYLSVGQRSPTEPPLSA